MASLYKRGRLFWVEYIDLAGARRQESTKLRWEVASEARSARDLCRTLTAAESDRLNGQEVWGAWVERFLAQRYAHSPGTLDRYRNSWRNLSAFLKVNGIHVPRQLTRQHVRDFIEWRQVRHGDLGVYEVSKNTALHEIKVLRLVMFEAVQSGFASVNPCSRLGIKADAAAKKPRITDKEHEKILAALEHDPEWMRVSYMIAWEQGCRFSETCLQLADIDVAKGIIRFRTKGEKANLAEFPLSARLVPLILKLKSEGRVTTFDMPAMPGKAWWQFFKRIKLPHLCFHCTRVTFVSRCYDAGIHRDDVMRLVGHATFAAHAVYPRLTADHSTAQSMRQLLQ